MTRSPVIRTLATILAALLLAAGLVVGGYGLLLSYKRGAISTPAEPAWPSTIETPGAVQRLAPHGDARAFAVAATARRESARLDHTVRIHAPAAIGPEAGVATFSSRTGSGFTWTPLDAGAADATGIVALPVGLPDDEASITLAANRAAARHRYFMRTDLPRRAARTRTTEFAAAPAATRFALDDDVGHCGPFQLVRVGDEEWRPPASLAAGLFVTADSGPLLLGPGDYELVDPIDASLRQRFTVPSALPIKIETRLARPRAGRR